eukprot:747704-Hanusia_phi.AAC.1
MKLRRGASKLLFLFVLACTDARRKSETKTESAQVLVTEFNLPCPDMAEQELPASSLRTSPNSAATHESRCRCCLSDCLLQGDNRYALRLITAQKTLSFSMVQPYSIACHNLAYISHHNLQKSEAAKG